MNYKELADILHIKGYEKIPEGDGKVKGLAYHSGKVEPGDVFFAIKGYETDGHKYIGSAKENGAVLAVVEEKTDDDIPQWIVENSRIALADASAAFFGDPSKDLFMIGITATNGKTTTSFMVDSILRAHGEETGLIGTVEVKYKDTVIPSLLTTPESYDLQNHLYHMREEGVETAVMEVSSSAQELYRNRGVDFDIVTFNNLSAEHIDQHGSFERYVEVKSRLIRDADEDTEVILNGDVPLINRLRKETKGRVYTFSLENDREDFTIKNVDLSTGRGTFEFVINRDLETKRGNIKKGTFPVSLGAVGYSSVMNSVVAIIISLLKKIPVETIREGLRRFGGVERRFEMIYDKEFTVLDDHFANVKNIDATMETLRAMEYNDLYIYYAIRGNRGVQLNTDVATRITHWLKDLNPKGFYATVSKDIVMKKDRVLPEEREVFTEIMHEDGREVPIYETVREGLDVIVPKLKKGDVLLLAGCQGMDKGAGVLLDTMRDLGYNELEDLEELVDNRIC